MLTTLGFAGHMDSAQTTQLLLVIADWIASEVMKTARCFLNIHILNKEICNKNEAKGDN